MPTNYGYLCARCEADFMEKAESYGGEYIEVLRRYQAYRREWRD